MKIVNNDVYLDQTLEKHNIPSYFSDFSKLRSGMSLITFPKNTFIYYNEAHKRYIYFLVSGQINVFASAADGKTMLIRYCDKFVLIGDMELMGIAIPPTPSKLNQNVYLLE